MNERRWLLARGLLALVLLSLWIAVERSAYLIVGTALIVTIFIFAPRIFEWEDAT